MTVGAVVVQVGPVLTMPGGIASVMREYLSMHLRGLEVRGYATYFPNRRLRGLVAAAFFPFWLLSRTRVGRSIVHVHLSEDGSFAREGLVVVASYLLRRPVVATLHGARFDEFVARRSGLARAVLSRCSTVFCLGEQHAALVRSLTDRPAIELIMNPVEVLDEATSRSVRTPTVVFGGEVGPRKGIDRLLTAWPRVLAAVPQARLVVCGPATAGWTELPDGIDGRGAVGRAQLRKELRTAAVACLPSRQEVLPMFILEALAEGTTVVATRAGEWRSLDGADNVRWVSNNDASVVEELADALIAALRKPASEATRASSIEWLRKRASRAAVGRALMAVYGELLAGGGRA